jgi:hypothetical protein
MKKLLFATAFVGLSALFAADQTVTESSATACAP